MKVNGKLLKDIFIHIGGDFLSKAIPFLLLPVLTRYLSSYDYGIVGNYQSVVSILTSLIGLSSSAWLATEYYSNAEGLKQKNFQSCLAFILITALIVFALILVLPEALTEKIGLTREILGLAGLHATGAAIIAVVLSQFQVSKRALQFASLNFTLIFFSTAIALWMIISQKMGYMGRIYSFLIAYTPVALYYFFQARPLHTFKTEASKRRLTEIARFGLPLVPHELSSWISNYIDRVFISTLISIESAGIYTVVFQICYAYEALLIATNRGIVPYMYEDMSRAKENPEAVPKIWKRIRILIAASTTIYLIGLTCGPFLYKHFIGGDFQQGLVVLPILLTAFYLKTYYYLFVNFIFYSKKTLRLSSITALVAVAQAGLSFALIKQIGIFGPAWAALGGSLLTSGLVVWFGVKEIKALSKSH